MVGISSLFTGLSAMHAQRRALDVIGHNVANVQTEGYHRQRVDLAAVTGTGANALFAGSGDGPYGVRVAGTTRSVDELLAARAVREGAAATNASSLAVTLRRIEGVFPEPTDVGLAHQLAEFWSAWSDVAHSPDEFATRSQLLERASTLVSTFGRTAADLTSVADQANQRLGMIAADANDLAAQVASLNATITANPSAAFDLLDQRAILVGRLADLVGAEARPAPGGQIDIYIGGRALVSGTVVQQLSSSIGTLEWSADGQPARPGSGEAATLLAVVNDVVPRYTAALDSVVATLVAEVNARHVTGYAQDGTTTGLAFFDGTTAATIALSADVAGQPGRIAAAGSTGSPHDGDIARQIAALIDRGDGPDALYRGMIAELGVETRAAIRRDGIQAQIADAARNDADAVGAVSIDEEMVALVSAQRAFEAAARFLTVVDDLLGTLIQRTGVVGR